MARLLFEKKGSAVWISHLDLMRLFQRAFKRAGLPLTHSKGFTPRPQVAIALPLSVGVESQCELLDFDLDGEVPSAEDIRTRLNQALLPGVQVLAVYNSERKIKDLALLSCVVTLEYNRSTPAHARDDITALFRQPQLIVDKKSKNGIQEQNIAPMIRRLEIVQTDEQTLELHALVCCQNPALNPIQLAVAIERYLPACSPDFFKISRVEIFDANETIFR